MWNPYIGAFLHLLIANKYQDESKKPSKEGSDSPNYPVYSSGIFYPFFLKGNECTNIPFTTSDLH